MALLREKCWFYVQCCTGDIRHVYCCFITLSDSCVHVMLDVVVFCYKRGVRISFTEVLNVQNIALLYSLSWASYSNLARRMTLHCIRTWCAVCHLCTDIVQHVYAILSLSHKPWSLPNACISTVSVSGVTNMPQEEYES